LSCLLKQARSSKTCPQLDRGGGGFSPGTPSLPTQLVNLAVRDPTGMTTFLSQVLIPIAVASVAAVLLLGLINMMRGGNPWRSQKLMQVRVLLQFVAIVVVMLTIWVMAGQQ
jgi:hypothetical protein